MPPLRAFITLCSAFILVTGLLFLGLSADSNQYAEKGESSSAASRFKALFSFRTPDSLFTPAATISLTDDNSTFFAARPAAFGPSLPPKGLSGQIWIGTGFGDDNHRRRGVAISVEGELGCSDIPGWSDSDWSSVVHSPGQGGRYPLVQATEEQASEDGLMVGELQRGHLDDGTDDYLHYPLSHTAIDKPSGMKYDEAEATIPSRRHPNIHGKVALLSRGGCGFSEKIQWAQRRGASAVIVGDSQRGGPLVRMYARDTANITIPSLFTTHMTAHLLSSLVPHGLGPANRRVSKDERLSRKLRAGSLRPASSSTQHRSRTPRFSPIEDDRSTAGGGPVTNPHGSYEPEYHDGLWVTLLMADMTISPFFNTLFVLVVSPLITLAIVYVMLLVRARIRRRRWRAPKSVVERLPVRIYHAISTRTSSSGSETPQPPLYTPSTPLLVGGQHNASSAVSRSGATAAGAEASTPSSSTQYGSLDSDASVREKTTVRPNRWRQRHGGKQVECSVCLEEYEDGVSKVMSLPCGHDFHVDCITPWLTTKRRTCPICKGDVVRSMGQNAAPSPNDDSGAPLLVAMEDVQVRAAETTNDSPSAALPVPGSGNARQPDLEQGEGDFQPSSQESSGARLARFPAVRAAQLSDPPSRKTQSLPDRER